jgi:ammonium transporter, Amt family
MLSATGLSWVLGCGFLVVLMHAGLALVATGLCRARNAAHTASMNLMVFALSAISFWAYGFGLAWGNQLGLKGFLLDGVDDPGLLARFFLLLVMFGVAAAIPLGAMAERWRWKSFCWYGLWIALPCSIYANWVWGNGWLAQAGRNWGLGHGVVDFAGSGVVHGMGGVIAAAGAMVLGPRLGKFQRGRPQPLPGHQIPLVTGGTFLVAVGGFGFTSGPVPFGTDLQFSAVAINTLLSSVSGALAAMLTLYGKRMKPDPTLMCNGLVAGLVAICASCPFVASWAAVVIGAVAGALVVQGIFLCEKWGLDDPVGAVSAHGASGLWGLLALGLFANGKHGAEWNGAVREEFLRRYPTDGVRGLFYGDAWQLLAQLLGAAVLLVFGFAMAYAWFKLSNLVVPLRAASEAEMAGLDGPEMGTMGYPDFTVSN